MMTLRERILAILFGPIAFFEMRLVALGIVAFIPEAALLYAGVRFASMGTTMTVLTFAYHVFIALYDKWAAHIPGELTEESLISRKASLWIGFLVSVLICIPLFKAIGQIYGDAMEQVESMTGLPGDPNDF